MDKLRQRFAALDRMPVPDVWSDAMRRAEELTMPAATGAKVTLASPTAVARPRSGAGMLVAVLVTIALIAILAVGGLAVGSWFTDQQRLAPVVAPSATATLPHATPRSAAPSTVPAGAAGPLIVFLRHGQGSGHPPADLWAIHADGSGAEDIFPGLGLPSVAWSPDGKRLLAVSEYRVYLAQVTGDGVGPFVDTGFDTGGATACNHKTGHRNPCQDAAFTFAPDGEHIAFVQRCTWSAPGCMFITTMDLRTGERTELTETQRNARHGVALPAWSPDGSSIAFTTETNQFLSESEVPIAKLSIVDADGRNLRRLDLGNLSVAAPQWSPDGNLIAFTSGAWLGDVFVQDIYTVRPDGSDLRQLTTDGVSAWPEWTGSNQIRFRHGGAGQQADSSTTIWLMDPDGSNAHQVAELGTTWGEVANQMSWIGVPGDPGRSLFWQPAP
jgi:WD40 repeat protein